MICFVQCFTSTIKWNEHILQKQNGQDTSLWQGGNSGLVDSRSVAAVSRPYQPECVHGQLEFVISQEVPTPLGCSAFTGTACGFCSAIFVVKASEQGLQFLPCQTLRHMTDGEANIYYLFIDWFGRCSEVSTCIPVAASGLGIGGWNYTFKSKIGLNLFSFIFLINNHTNSLNNHLASNHKASSCVSYCSTYFFHIM